MSMTGVSSTYVESRVDRVLERSNQSIELFRARRASKIQTRAFPPVTFSTPLTHIITVVLDYV